MRTGRNRLEAQACASVAPAERLKPADQRGSAHVLADTEPHVQYVLSAYGTNRDRFVQSDRLTVFHDRTVGRRAKVGGMREHFVHTVPVHGVVDVVEVIAIGVPQGKRRSRVRLLRGTGEPRTPLEAMVFRRGRQTVKEIVRHQRGGQGVLVHVDPEPLGLDPTTVRTVESNAHGAPPQRYSRAPAAEGDVTRPFERLDDIDDRALNDPMRMNLAIPRIDQLLGTDLLDVARDPIEAGAALIIDVAGEQLPAGTEHVAAVGQIAQRFKHVTRAPRHRCWHGTSLGPHPAGRYALVW